MYEIKKGLAIEKRMAGYAPKYPFDELEVGDAFDVPLEDVRVGTLRQSAYVWGTRNKSTGKKLRCIAYPDFTRVQRIA